MTEAPLPLPRTEKPLPAALPGWLWPALVAAVTIVVFRPVLGLDFINWDDPVNFTTNEYYRGLGWAQLRWMFTTFHMGHYVPVTWLTFGLDFVLWGMNPWGYHLTSVLFHAANAVLFYVLAMRLTALARGDAHEDGPFARSPAALAALLFAIHPLRAESVAWLTARRDVVSGFFVLLSTLSYLEYSKAGGGRKSWRWASIGLFALAVLARENCVMLAPVLLILDVYPLARLRGGPRSWVQTGSRGVLLEKLPYFLIAAAGGLMAVWATAALGQMVPVSQRSFSGWVAQAGYQLAFHVRKTFWPAGLGPMYEIPGGFDPWSWRFLASDALVAGLAWALWQLRRVRPAAAAAGAAYALFLVPTLGIADTISLAYDRFSYLSCMGWALLAAGAWGTAWEAPSAGGRGRRRRLGAAVAAALALPALAHLTMRQCTFWRDSGTLWRRALEVDPSSCVARNNLAQKLVEEHQVPEAVRLLKEALPLAVGRTVSPTLVEIHTNLCYALTAQGGDIRAAEAHCLAAVRLQPGHAIGQYNLGAIAQHFLRYDDAIRHFDAALRADPTLASARYELGRSLVALRRYAEAVPYFRGVTTLARPTAELENSLCYALARLGQREEAMSHCRQALKLIPHYQAAALNLYYLEAPSPAREQVTPIQAAEIISRQQ